MNLRPSTLLLSVVMAGFVSLAEAATLPQCAEGHDSRYDYQNDARQTGLGNEGYAGYTARLKRTECRKVWTVLVYMQADNNLTPYALMDLYEMEAGFANSRDLKAGSTLRSDLVVQVDTNLSSQVRRLHMFQTPENYDSTLTVEDFKSRSEKDIRSPIVESFDERERPRSAAQDLEEFLKWGVTQYPSDHYMVIVWGHGQGWTSVQAGGEKKVSSKILGNVSIPNLSPLLSALPVSVPEASMSGRSTFAGRGFGGLAFSETTQTYLSIPELSRVLENVSQKTLRGKPIDIYASDACLMQMVEVAYELSRSTQYIVGSTQVQNFLGLPYRRLMTELNTAYFGEKSKAAPGADEVYLAAKMIPKVFKSSMMPQGSQGRLDKKALRSITMSTLNSSELRTFLAPQLAALSHALCTYIDEDSVRVVDLQFVMQQTPSFMGGAEDLGAFLTLLSQLLSGEAQSAGTMSVAASALADEVALTREALQRSVVGFVLGTQYSGKEEQFYLLGIRAVSMWLPATREDYVLRAADFKKSKLMRVKSHGHDWLSFIDKIYK